MLDELLADVQVATKIGKPPEQVSLPHGTEDDRMIDLHPTELPVLARAGIGEGVEQVCVLRVKPVDLGAGAGSDTDPGKYEIRSRHRRWRM